MRMEDGPLSSMRTVGDQQPQCLSIAPHRPKREDTLSSEVAFDVSDSLENEYVRASYINICESYF